MWTSALKINIALAEREDLEGIVAFPGEKEEIKSTASGPAASGRALTKKSLQNDAEREREDSGGSVAVPAITSKQRKIRRQQRIEDITCG